MEQFEQDLLNNGYELVNSFEYNPNPNELDVTNIFIIYKGKIDNIWVEVSWFKKTNIDYGPDKYRVQLDDDTHMSIATTFVKNYSELEKFVKNYIKKECVKQKLRNAMKSMKILCTGKSM